MDSTSELQQSKLPDVSVESGTRLMEASSAWIKPAVSANNSKPMVEDLSSPVINEQRITIKPGHANQLDMIKAFARMSRSEEGVVQYRAFVNADNPSETMILEDWKNKAALDAHIHRDAGKWTDSSAFTRQSVSLKEFGTDPQYPPAINPSINDSNVIKEQRITVKPGVNANQLESDLYELAEHTRAEKGCLSYRLFEGTDESLTAGDVSKKILLLEQWDNQADLNQHKLSPWLTDFFKKHGNDFERQAVTWKELR